MSLPFNPIVFDLVPLHAELLQDLYAGADALVIDWDIRHQDNISRQDNSSRGDNISHQDNSVAPRSTQETLEGNVLLVIFLFFLNLFVL